jgi:hypothetical protein
MYTLMAMEAQKEKNSKKEDNKKLRNEKES